MCKELSIRDVRLAREFCPCAIVWMQICTRLPGEATSGSDQEAHIRSEGSPNKETSSGRTQGISDPQTTGYRRQGRRNTPEE